MPPRRCEMARDVYTRRQEGVSIWVVASQRDHRQQPGREGRTVRPGGRQDLPPPDLLRDPGRSGAHVTERRLSTTCCTWPTTPWCSASAMPNGAATAPILEEDIALSNVSLDLIGQARLLYQLVASARMGGDCHRRPAGLFPRRARVPQLHAARTAAPRPAVRLRAERSRLRAPPSSATSCTAP